jgi:hypothetical protein
VFTGYALSRRGEFSMRRICVFYSPGSSSTHTKGTSTTINTGSGGGGGNASGSSDNDDLPRGCLHWCAVGQRLESQHFSLPLAKVRELQLGKQSPVRYLI